MKISIIGSGSWGTAIGIMLAENGHSVTLWSYTIEESDALRLHKENRAFLPGFVIPESIGYTNDLSLASDADIIICATPSFAVGQVMRELKYYIKPGQIILNISKGLEMGSLSTLATVIKREIVNLG